MAHQEDKPDVREPAMRFLEEMNSAEWSSDMPRNAAKDHDRYLAAAYSETRAKRRRK